MALKRSSAVRYVAPIIIGAVPVTWSGRQREVTLLGSTSELLEIRRLSMAQGRFLPRGDPSRGASVCVLGYKLKEELFGTRSPLGQRMRIGGRGFRVIGVMARKGQSVGLDMGDLVVIPVAAAQALFNSFSLFRVTVEARSREAIGRAKRDMVRIIRERHEGEDDVTIITQDAVLSTFDRIFTALTLTVAGIGAISLAVAGILIMNVMLIAVSQRRAEVGLLKAIGANKGHILVIFLAESAVLSLMGACLGIALSVAGTWALIRIFPAFPMSVPPWAVWAAVGMCLATGLIFGVLPARRAARLDPVQSLSRR
jgi:putative ABC transport system permease protein